LGVVGKITADLGEWVLKSELLKDAFKVLKFFAEYIAFQVKAIFSVLELIWNNLVKPQLDRLENIYSKLKSLLGLGGDGEIKVSSGGGNAGFGFKGANDYWKQGFAKTVTPTS